MGPSRIIHAAAPTRICDNGGWTDTAVARHGKVFNIAVRPLVEVRVDVFRHHTRDARVIINADNYALRYAPALRQSLWGPHPLVEAALHAVPPPDAVDIEITIGSDAPPGASTGTSAALAVALLGALDCLVDRRRSSLQIANDAHALETKWLERQSGVQDQLCSAFGGINFIEITNYPHAVVTPLHVEARIARELDARLAVIYLGRSHDSSALHERVIEVLEVRGADCPELEALRTAADSARDAVVAGDFQALGRAMQRNTEAQAALHPDLIHPDAWRVIELAAAHGALGWKVNGAGGDGGSITLLCDSREGARAAILTPISEDNPKVVPIPCALSPEGLRVWTQS